MNLADPKLRAALREPYDIRDNKIFCIDAEVESTIGKEMGSGINVVKKFLKRSPAFYEFLRAFFSPGISVVPYLTPRRAIMGTFSTEEISSKIIVNVGAGVKFLHKDVINLDVYPYEHTHIVADGAKLPFKDNSVDMILCESVLEHVMEPYKVMEEIKRVLVPGGYAYIDVPFIYPFHASPNDFTRFTRNFLRRQFESFTIVKEGLRAGPMTALQGVLMHVFALIFSFGSYGLYLVLSNIFMIIFSPLKLLDIFFIFFSYSHEIAADMYILARKK